MAFTADQIKDQIQRILVVLRPIADYTETEIDNRFVEVLSAIEASDELLDLVELYFGGDEDPLLTRMSDDARIDWERVEPQLHTLENVLSDMRVC